MKLYRNKDGQKLYPVCNWEHNQHKLYNAHDRAMVALYEGTGSYTEVDRIEQAMDAFEKHVIGGMVYATYEDGILIKEYVWAYNARH